jgi:hypothetical protein
VASIPGARPSLALAKSVWHDRTKRRLVLLATIFVAQIGYATFVGGDAWEWMLYANRYTCVAMPALIVVSAAVLDRVISGAAHVAFARRFAWGLVASGVVLVVLNVYAKLRPEQGIAATIVFSNTPFAAGGAMILAGLLLQLRDARRGIAEGLAALGRRFASRTTVAGTALLAAALLWLPSHLLPLGRWAAQNAAQYADEARYTRLGLLIRADTPPPARRRISPSGRRRISSARTIATSRSSRRAASFRPATTNGTTATASARRTRSSSSRRWT